MHRRSNLPMDPSTVTTVHLPMIYGPLQVYNMRLPGPIPASAEPALSTMNDSAASKSNSVSPPADSASPAALTATVSQPVVVATAAANGSAGGTSASAV